jgi:ABC-type transport system involved in cytochrome bd biosynthesis fused ATPase/permease subunit
MIFDEIICSLNKESRNTVLEIFNGLKERQTIIIIDKNEDVLKMSDNIVLFNEGLVSESGEFDLVSENKLYKKIVSN